jgi:hypothetical protein
MAAGSGAISGGASRSLCQREGYDDEDCVLCKEARESSCAVILSAFSLPKVVALPTLSVTHLLRDSLIICISIYINNYTQYVLIQ